MRIGKYIGQESLIRETFRRRLISISENFRQCNYEYSLIKPTEILTAPKFDKTMRESTKLSGNFFGLSFYLQISSQGRKSYKNQFS